LDLWALARYDLGLSWEEFEELTPAMFQALCKRRNVRIKYERLANALTASVVANVNRSKADDPIIQPFDFIRDGESAQKKERLDAAKRHCKKVMNVPSGTSREKIMEIRGRAIKDLEAAGYENAENIMDSCWPHLAKKESQ
jgi:hypothetical protein